MYEIVPDSASGSLKVTSAGTVLLDVRTKKQIAGLPSQLLHLKPFGRDWIQVVLAGEVVAFRFSNQPDNGVWYTPFPFEGASPQEIQKWLELRTSNNRAQVRATKAFPAGSTILVSIMTSSEVVQIYDPSPWKLE